MSDGLEVVELNLDDELSLELEQETSNEIESEFDPTLSYPCLVISGITLEVEAEFIRDRKIEEENSLPLYILADGMKIPAGRTDMTMSTLLVYYRLGYSIEVWKEDGSRVDISDPKTFINFIRL